MTLSTATPVITSCDNRGITVRTLNWNRESDQHPLRLLLSHSQLEVSSRTTLDRDPRRFIAWQKNNTAVPNLHNRLSLAGQILKRDSTDSGWQVMLFNAEGGVAWGIDARGTIQTHAWDALGRPVSGTEQAAGDTLRTAWRKEYGDAVASSEDAYRNNLRGVCVRQYDDGGLLSINAIALSGAVLQQTKRFLNDAEGKPDWPENDTACDALLEAGGFVSTTVANAAGAPISCTDAQNNIAAAFYDVSGTICRQTLKLAGQTTSLTLLERITCNPVGLIAEEIIGNGLTTTYSYEPETLRLHNLHAVRSDSSVLQDLTYGYDRVGNRTSITDSTVSTRYYQNQSTSGDRIFTYDALYQLISACGRENASNTQVPYAELPTLIPTDSNQTLSYTRSYQYDDSGNLSSFSHLGAASFTRTMVISTQSNRSLLQNGSNSLTADDTDAGFDPCGNLRGLPTSATTTDNMRWDNSNHLQAVILLDRKGDIQQSDREIYQYSAGVRIRKQTRILTKTDSNLWTVDEVRYLPGLELRRHWQETVNGDTITPQAATEALHVITTQAGRASIRVLHWESGKPASINNDQVRWSVDDSSGAASLELDAQGQIISHEEYYPFGGTAVWAARSELEASYKVIRYSGKERDGTGLYYYGYRYYAPWLCRWTTADPGQEIDGLNLYRMVRNNPLTLTDVDGLMPKLVLTKEEIAEFEHLYDSALKSGKYRRNTPDMKRFVLTNHSRASTYSLKSESVIDILFHVMYQQSKYVLPPESWQKAMRANKEAQAQAAQAAADNGKKAILYVWAAQSHLIQNASPKERLNADKVVKHIRKLNRDPNASRDRHDFFGQNAHKGVENGIYELDGKTGEELAKLLDEYIKSNATLINKTLYRGTTTLPSVRPGRFTATSESQNIASLFGKHIETFKGGYGVRVPNIYCNRDEREYLFSRSTPPKPVHSTTPRQRPLDPGAGCSKAA
ncbi:RHS repeat-associated core domain-containing protein [Salmonella enterica subsp. houtenae serovar 16:z4,z23:-]